MPFIGLANFSEAFTDPRFGAAVLRTTIFAAISVPLELALGLAFALVMHRIPQARGLARVATLLPFAIPTVVAALIWRFIIGVDRIRQPPSSGSPAARRRGFRSSSPTSGKRRLSWRCCCWPGLQAIDEELYDAARMDGARASSGN